MPDSTPLAAGHPLPLLREDAWRGAEPPSLAAPVCFGRRQFAGHDGTRPYLRLSPAHAEALAEVLPVLLCGEESAALAMDQIAGSGDLQHEMRAALERIALDELAHQTLLQRLAPLCHVPTTTPGCPPRCDDSSCGWRVASPRRTAHGSPPWMLGCASC